MKLDERNIDAFEQDLMLSYVRQLYDSFAPDKPVVRRKVPVLPPEEEMPVVQKQPVKKAPAPKPVEPKIPKVVETPKEKPNVEEKTKEVKVPKVMETPKPAAAPLPPKPKPASPVSGLSPADRAALFEFKEATELSEKLSMAPIKDLKKAMGLNEKIFTINELFGGDSKVFDETIKKLDSFSSFSQASDYLAGGVKRRYN